MQPIFAIVGVAITFVVVMGLLRAIFLGPMVVAQLEFVDKPVGLIQYLKLYAFYLRHPDRLQKSISFK